AMNGDRNKGGRTLRAMMRKPSCLISCSHWLPDGSLSILVGRHGAMKPVGRVRCNMCTKIKLGTATYYQKPAFFCLGSSRSSRPWGGGCVVASLGRWAGSPSAGRGGSLGHDAPADRVVTSPGPSRAL